jgi:hypothetical protein
MNEAFEKYCEDNAIPKHGSVAREHWITFRAGMLAAADKINQMNEEGTAPSFWADAIRGAAK